MRTVVRASIASAAAILLANASVHAATIKLATWNMNNLHYVIGEPLRDGAQSRSEEDYQLLREYRDRLDADVIALQEVNGPRAAGLVFPPDQYDLYFSARYIDDLVTGRATHLDPEQRSDRIYTGFAVRRGVFDAVSKRDVPSLGVTHAADGRLVRWGTEIVLEKDGQLLRILSVHLKSGCHGGSLEKPSRTPSLDRSTSRPCAKKEVSMPNRSNSMTRPVSASLRMLASSQRRHSTWHMMVRAMSHSVSRSSATISNGAALSRPGWMLSAARSHAERSPPP